MRKRKGVDVQEFTYSNEHAELLTYTVRPLAWQILE